MPDVITVTSGTTGTPGSTGSVAGDLQTYFAAKLLKVAERRTVLKQFGEKVPLPPASSKTIAFVRAEKFSVSATPTQLDEGVTPGAVGMSYSQITAVVEQYGFLSKISDLANLTAKHPVVQACMYNQGLHAAEIYDQLVFNNIVTGSQVYRPNSRGSLATLLPTDQVTYKDLIKIQANLQDQAARPFGDGLYVLVTCPSVHNQLLLDPDFKASVQYRAPEKMWRAEVGTFGGFSIINTNSPAFNFYNNSGGGSGNSNKNFYSFALGESAFQITDLQSLEVVVTPPGGQSDGLKQRTLIGYKFCFKTKITNDNWIERIESAGLPSVAN